MRSDELEDEDQRERRRLREWHEQHDLTSVAIERAILEDIAKQGTAENWTPEQYQSALSDAPVFS